MDNSMDWLFETNHGIEIIGTVAILVLFGLYVWRTILTNKKMLMVVKAGEYMKALNGLSNGLTGVDKANAELLRRAVSAQCGENVPRRYGKSLVVEMPRAGIKTDQSRAWVNCMKQGHTNVIDGDKNQLARCGDCGFLVFGKDAVNFWSEG